MADAKEVIESERDFIYILITLYRDSPELWKVKSKDYYDQNKKQIALRKIVEQLLIFKADLTVEKLRKKINTLRTNFNKDFKAIESAKRSGASADDIPGSKLWYYSEMLFIKDQMEIAQTDSSETESLRSQLVEVEDGVEINCPPIQIRKRKRNEQNSTEELVGLASAYFKKPESEYDVIAKGWAFKLSRLSPDQKIFAEKIINDTLFEAEMGNLTRYGANFKSAETPFMQTMHHSSQPAMFRYPSVTSYPTPGTSRASSPAMSPPSVQEPLQAEMSAREYLSTFSTF